MWEYVYKKTRDKRSIVFCNSVADCEETAVNLRSLAAQEETSDIYHVHHGCISAALKSYTEDSMKSSSSISVIATSSLEMGIDIGDLDRVLQINSPVAVASFIQRLGRSGRRGKPSEMFFICHEEEIKPDSPLPYHIPWNLIQNIAIIQLYLEDKWIEPKRVSRYPFGLLYHQTLSTLVSMGELPDNTLAKMILDLSPFQHISLEDYRELLNHMEKLGHIQRMEDGGLIIGLEGEKLVNNYQFYAVFPNTEEYTVIFGTEQIGIVFSAFETGETFTLAGISWEVKNTDLYSKIIYVAPLQDRIRVSQAGELAKIHTRVLQKMKQVLVEDVEYKYLQANAKKRLGEVRMLARKSGLIENNIIRINDKFCCIFPWFGSIEYNMFLQIVRHYLQLQNGVSGIESFEPYYLMLQSQNYHVDTLLNNIKNAVNSKIDFEQLILDSEVRGLKRKCDSETPKFDRYVPEKLLKKALINDYINYDLISQTVTEWKCFGSSL